MNLTPEYCIARIEQYIDSMTDSVRVPSHHEAATRLLECLHSYDQSLMWAEKGLALLLQFVGTRPSRSTALEPGAVIVRFLAERFCYELMSVWSKEFESAYPNTPRARQFYLRMCESAQRRAEGEGTQDFNAGGSKGGSDDSEFGNG